MGYETPLVVKEVYLPLEYDFIFNNNLSFGEFAKLYKEKYGIDLHDIFELVSDGNSNPAYFVRLKFPCKIYVVALGDYKLGKSAILVQEGIKAMNVLCMTSADRNLLDIGINYTKTLISNLLDEGFGFSLVLPDSAPQTIDDLRVFGIEL